VTTRAESYGLWRDLPVRPMTYVETGYLLVFAQAVVRVLWLLNIIEYWKILFMLLGGSRQQSRAARSLAIDTFMLLKWVVLACFVWFEIKGTVAQYLIGYLIGSVFFSYFYYHVWQVPSHRDSHARQIRRTLAFMLSFFFVIAGYAYIFMAGYADDFAWPEEGGANFGNAMLLSLSNAFTGSFGLVQPLTASARWVLAGEMIFIFGFLAIVIVNSIPLRRQP